MSSVNGKVSAFNAPRVGKNTHSVFEGFLFGANVYSEAKPNKVVGEEGDPFFGVGHGFKEKFSVV